MQTTTITTGKIGDTVLSWTLDGRPTATTYTGRRQTIKVGYQADGTVEIVEYAGFLGARPALSRMARGWYQDQLDAFIDLSDHRVKLGQRLHTITAEV